MSTVDHIEALKAKHASLEHAIDKRIRVRIPMTMRSAASRNASYK